MVAAVDMITVWIVSMTPMDIMSVGPVLTESIVQMQPCNSNSMTALALTAATARTLELDMVDSKFISAIL